MLSGTLINKVSHHFPIFTTIKCNKNTQNSKYIQYYDYCNTNIESLIAELPTNDDNSYEQLISDFDHFSSVFNSLIDKHCKLEKPKTSKRNNKMNPWIIYSKFDK